MPHGIAHPWHCPPTHCHRPPLQATSCERCYRLRPQASPFLRSRPLRSSLASILASGMWARGPFGSVAYACASRLPTDHAIQDEAYGLGIATRCNVGRRKLGQYSAWSYVFVEVGCQHVLEGSSSTFQQPPPPRRCSGGGTAVVVRPSRRRVLKALQALLLQALHLAYEAGPSATYDVPAWASRRPSRVVVSSAAQV